MSNKFYVTTFGMENLASTKAARLMQVKSELLAEGDPTITRFPSVRFRVESIFCKEDYATVAMAVHKVYFEFTDPHEEMDYRLCYGDDINPINSIVNQRDMQDLRKRLGIVAAEVKEMWK